MWIYVILFIAHIYLAEYSVLIWHESSFLTSDLYLMHKSRIHGTLCIAWQELDSHIMYLFTCFVRVISWCCEVHFYQHINFFMLLGLSSYIYNTLIFINMLQSKTVFWKWDMLACFLFCSLFFVCGEYVCLFLLFIYIYIYSFFYNDFIL